MRFKDQAVFVRADADGRPILDAGGRAEMKYREADSKSYRPAPGNRVADAGDGPGDGEGGFDGAATRPSAVLVSKGTARGGATAAPRSRRPARLAPAGLETMAGAIEVWTDGACSGNPGPMGIGVVVIDGERRRELGDYLGVGTNNIAELVAIERGLEIAAEAAASAPGRRIRVYSDSGYSIGLLSQGWKAKANQELVARIRKRLAAIPNVEFVKVPGHAGVPENERCDELARQAISRRGTVGAAR